MSFSDSPREPRAPRKARPRLSLKMQAIGFLSRREHSRQELRSKLLDSLRKRAREEAALEAASEKAAREWAEVTSYSDMLPTLKRFSFSASNPVARSRERVALRRKAWAKFRLW